MSFPKIHQRVKWQSRYDGITWFKGIVVSVADDRAVVRCDSDMKTIVIPTYRLSVIEPGWKPRSETVA